MVIYLASGFNRRESLRNLAKKLEDKGHCVSSEWIWLDLRTNRNSKDWDDFAYQISRSNIKDLRRSEALVIDAYGIRPDNNGGVHTELGWALAKNLEIYLIGPRKNTFHWLIPQENLCKTYEQLLNKL